MNILSGTIAHNFEDYINITSVFGDVNRVILSKDFKGGKVKNLFGNTELDFTNADLSGVAVLDISQAFGQVSIAVPQDWRVEGDITHFASEMDDERSYLTRTSKSNKVLIITGLSVFAAVEIVNFISPY